MVLVDGQQIPEHNYCVQQCVRGDATVSTADYGTSKKKLWIGAGVVALLAGGAFLVLRKKR